jgi:hypothetical protein
MIAESFDPRTLANMEVALERACKVLPTGGEEHSVRRKIASKILKYAESGDKTLGGLTDAGRAAARAIVRRTGLTPDAAAGIALAEGRHSKGDGSSGKQANRRQRAQR